MSLPKEMTELGIPRTSLNLLRNNLIKFECGPLVYRTIIQWGFALPTGKKIIDHINDLKIGKKNKEKKFPKWLKDNESKLNKHSFSDFDITTLHDFLPILCYDKMAQTGGKEYEERIKNPSSVESLLKEIKTFRNEVSHEYAEAVKDSHIDNMKQTMIECIRAAGKLYGKDQTEIDEKVKVLDDEFDTVLLNTTSMYENRIAKFIKKEAPAILLEKYSPHFSVPLPGNWTKKDTSEIFQCSKISITDETKKGIDHKTIFPCTKIFNRKQNKFVVINGGPGSGKTTLFRNMCQDILHTSVHGSAPRYDKIEQFKIPIYLECRNEQQTNLATFLKQYFENFLSPEDDILEAFKTVKGLVFLIDGYDEININCRKLVDSIKVFCRDYNASCMVSSRVDAGNNFFNELQNMNMSCTKMSIEPIDEMDDKKKFLRSYAVKMVGSIDTTKLVNSFENLTNAAKEVFSSPILLALFISLFVNDPDSVSKMKNELSAYEAVRTNFLLEMTRKLRNAPNPKGRAEDVAYVLSRFCLNLFKAKKYFVEKEDYSKIVAECEKIKGMPGDVDIPSLLSCILTPEHSLKYTLYKSFQFMHSTIQEFFAAKYVRENIRELQDDENSQSQSEDRQLPNILQVLGLEESQSDIKEEIKRYGNIIKLLILETLANGELSKYKHIFTQLLKKYFEQRIQKISPTYHLDLILSSDSNADIISIVSDCIRDWDWYYLEYYRHITPMTKVILTNKNGVKIIFKSKEVTNTRQIIKLVSVLGYNSEIELDLLHSYHTYQPLEAEFYRLLKISKYKLKGFAACITSEEHLSIVVKVFKGDWLDISTPSVSAISFAAFKEYKENLILTVKYTDDCPSTGSNPVNGKTTLWIDEIPADGKRNVYKIIKYVSHVSKRFEFLNLDNCHLAYADAVDLLYKLYDDKLRTSMTEETVIRELFVREDGSKWLELNLAMSEEEKRKSEEDDEEEKFSGEECKVS